MPSQPLTNMPANPFALLDEEEEVTVSVVAAPVNAKSGGAKTPAVAAPKATGNTVAAAKKDGNKPKAAQVTAASSDNIPAKAEGRNPRDPQGRDRKKDGKTTGNERNSNKAEKNGDHASKKEGHGSGNAGSVKDVISEGIAQVTGSDVATEIAPAVAAEETKTAEPEEPKTVSYAEFMAKKNAAKTIAAAKVTRKAGEGVDAKQWSNANLLVKVDDEPVEEEVASEAKGKTQRSQNKETIVIDIKLAPSEKIETREAREYSGPAGGRGGARNKGPSSNSPKKGNAANFQVDFEADFPKM